MPTEFSFIQQIRQQARSSQTDLTLGIGDDAAIWRERAGRERLITTDLLVEDIHFKLEYTPLRCLAHKALAVSLSDIAAMGGKAEYALLSLGLPRLQFAQLNWQDFFDGYFALAQKHGVTLIGGDTSASPDKVVIDSIVLGSCASGKSVRRSGAKVGDAIYVTGSLGASAAGLELLQRGVRFDDTARDEANEAIRTHLLPEPRLAFGQKLGALGLAQAMMDVSDGLLQDLMHICEESGVDAAVECAAVPVADAAFTIAEAAEVAFSWALGGGEDYELLFTAAPRRETKLRQCAAKYGVAITRIGEIIARDPAQLQPQVFLLQDGRVDLPTVTGYDHFRA